ncbi:clasp N terminal-domain-containing protein [Gloeopeniophorella convolvens]|nr:clasp N terminal-domain-containing protein [Gloeopeniophorella convolvens]
MAPKAKIPAVIECHSESVLQDELERARASLTLVESEETWDTISNAILRIIAISKGGACEYPTTLTSSIRSMYRPITSAAVSERSRLSSAAVECIAALAIGLGTSFDPLVPLFVPALLSICSRPNKIFISRAKAAIQTIIDQTQLISLLPYFVGALGDKSATLRLIAIESVLACVQCFNPPDLEKETRAKDVENAIKLTATDASADVRKASRLVFDAYKILLPSRVESFTAPLSPTMRKYLNINAPSVNSRPPSQQSTHSLPTTRPASSMATAIPTKRADPLPRPATSIAHYRSASSSALASQALPDVATSAASGLTRSQTESTLGRLEAAPFLGPLPKHKHDMPPPDIIPQRRPPQHAEAHAFPGRPTGPMRPEPRAADRPEPSASRPHAQILRPDATQHAAPARPQPGPMRARTMTIKERLLGGARRVPLPEPQPQPSAQPPPQSQPPARAPIPPQEKKAAADVPSAPKRSRVDSVRHGLGSSATMEAKRAVAQVSAAAAAPKRRDAPAPAEPAQASEKKEASQRPPPAVEKKTVPKPSSKPENRPGPSKPVVPKADSKKEAPKPAPSASGRPKSSMSTRSADKVARVQKDAPKPTSSVTTTRAKPTQPTKVAVPAPSAPPKKPAARSGGATQPTLSQLSRMKAAEEEKGRRAAAKGPVTKSLAVKKAKAAAPAKATAKQTEVPPAAISTPLPPSPEVKAVEVPLPESPVIAPLDVQEVQVEAQQEEQEQLLAQPEQAEVQQTAPPQVDSGASTPSSSDRHPVTPAQDPLAHPFGVAAPAVAGKTPISALVNSIQRGFLFSPNSPLSPPQPDMEWECPAWPGLPVAVSEEPSFDGVEESTIKRPLAVAGPEVERRALADMNS